MNDDKLLEALDDRAGAAAADLRGRAASRPRPAFDAEWGSALPAPRPVDQRRSLRPLLAVAAVAVVLGSVAAGLALRSGESDDAVDGPSTEMPRPFAATDLPDGMTPAIATEYPGSKNDTTDNPYPASFDVYGPSTDHPGLGVVAEWLMGDHEPGSEAIDLGDGRNALVVENLLPGTVLTFDIETTSVLIFSQELDRAVMADIAAHATLDGDRMVLDGASLPDGWRHIGTHPDLLRAMSATGSGISGPEHTVIYTAGTGEEVASAVVSSAAGDVLQLNLIRLLMRDVHPVVVRGHDGLIGRKVGRNGENGMRMLVWLERPGELVRVSGSALSEEELLELAEGVEPLDNEAWSDLLRRSRLGGLNRPYEGPPADLIGEGTFADGAAWALRKASPTGEAEHGSVTLFVDTGTDTSGSSSGSSSDSSGSGRPMPIIGFEGMSTLNQAYRYFIYGLIGQNVASVELRRTDGTAIGQATVVEGQGVRAWVIELTEEQAEVVALDQAGQEVDRLEVHQDGESGNSGETPSSSPVSPTTTR